MNYETCHVPKLRDPDLQLYFDGESQNNNIRDCSEFSSPLENICEQQTRILFLKYL